MCGIEGKFGMCDREIVRTMMSEPGWFTAAPAQGGLLWGRERLATLSNW